MNKTILIGNLGKDPETTQLQNSNNSVCKFSLGVARKFQDKDGTRQTDWFNIIAWNKLGENCQKYLKKGNKAVIVGRVETRQYEAQDGTKRNVVEVIADEVEFIKTDNNSQGGASNDATNDMTPVADDNLPF